MNDDQSMRDRVAGRQGPDGEAGDGAQPGSSPAGPTPASTPLAGSPSGASEPAAARDAPAGDGAGGAGDTGTGEPGPGGAGEQDGTDKSAAGGAKTRRSGRSFWRELPVLIVVALVIALLIKTFVVQAFYIPSSSMENTLKIGDKVLVNKLVYHLRPIRAGDIVVFDGAGSWDPVPTPAKPNSDPVVRLYDATLRPLFRSIGGLFGTAPGQTDYIKRVIGVPGDHVACCNARGQVTVNGVALHERSYLFPNAAPSQIHFSETVPPGRLWVMGDNRLVSDDSRLHGSDPGDGTIPENKVVGRAFLIVWPPDRWRILQIPATFGQPGITHAAAAAAAALGRQAAPVAPFLPLAGGLAVALPVTLLQRRLRLRGRRGLRRR
jgi:signal peptidase I